MHRTWRLSRVLDKMAGNAFLLMVFNQSDAFTCLQEDEMGVASADSLRHTGVTLSRG